MEYLHLEAALARAGVIPPRAEGSKAWQWAGAPKDGFHVLRHTYAWIMLEASVAWTLFTFDHSRLLCSLRAGGRQQGGAAPSTVCLGSPGDQLASRNSPDSPQRC